MTTEPASDYWYARARRLCRRVNLATWVSRWIPWLVGASVAGALGLIAGRRLGVAAGGVWVALSVGIAVGAVVAAVRARPSFFSPSDALVHLDATLGLHCRLASASAGVGRWPPPPSTVLDGVRWNWHRVAAPVGFSVALLAVAGFVPVAPRAASATTPPDPPGSWKEMESWLAGLEERTLVQDGAIDAWSKRLDELRRRPPQEWFGHSALEAGDSLRQQMAGSLRELRRELDRADAALGAIEALPPAARDQDLEMLGRELRGAATALESGPLPLYQDLLSRLREQAPLRTLSSEQVARLRELQARLREGAGFCRIALRECREGDEECLRIAARRSGRAGVSRGPGTLPLTLDPDRTELGTREVAGVSNPDASRAAPGDLLGVGRSRHRVESGDFRRPTTGGGVASSGTGGDTVWRSAATPAERKVLERYFN